MKKAISTIAAVVLIICLVAALGACGNKDNNNTTNNTTSSTAAGESSTSMLNAEDGIITDQSESGNNGAVGELASDISEGLTDLSQDMNG